MLDIEMMDKQERTLGEQSVRKLLILRVLGEFNWRRQSGIYKLLDLGQTESFH